MPSTFSAVRRDQPVREQVQPQVGVVGVGGLVVQRRDHRAHHDDLDVAVLVAAGQLAPARRAPRPPTAAPCPTGRRRPARVPGTRCRGRFRRRRWSPRRRLKLHSHGAPTRDHAATATRLASTGVGLDLRGDPIALTAALVDIPSESRHEQRIADEVEAALREQTTGFEIVRNGDAVLARTDLGLPSRVLLAGHLDTVPTADNVPSRRVDGELHGCGTSDMKSGDAVFLHLAATVAEPGARHHAGHVRLRGDRGRRQRSGPHRTRAARLAAGRRRHPRRAVRRLHRGGLPGHAAGRRQRRAAPARIRRDRGWATTRFTSSVRCSTG